MNSKFENVSRVQGFDYHAGAIADVRWNCDGSFLGSIGIDKTVKIASLEKNGELRVVQTIPGINAKQIAWHPTEPNSFAIAGEEKTLDLWEVRAQQAKAKIAVHGGGINMAWSPDGGKIAVGTFDNKLFVVDATSQTFLASNTRSYKYDVNRMVWGSRSDYLLLAVGKEGFGNVEILRFSDGGGELLSTCASLPAHSNDCVYMELSSQGRLALSSTDQTVSLWQAREMLCYASIQYDGVIRGMCFTADGALLAVSGDGKLVDLYNAADGTLARRVDSKNGSKITKLAFHPSKPLLVIGTDAKPLPPSAAAGYSNAKAGSPLCMITFSESTAAAAAATAAVATAAVEAATGARSRAAQGAAKTTTSGSGSGSSRTQGKTGTGAGSNSSSNNSDAGREKEKEKESGAGAGASTGASAAISAAWSPGASFQELLAAKMGQASSPPGVAPTSAAAAAAAAGGGGPGLGPGPTAAPVPVSVAAQQPPQLTIVRDAPGGRRGDGDGDGDGGGRGRGGRGRGGRGRGGGGDAGGGEGEGEGAFRGRGGGKRKR